MLRGAFTAALLALVVPAGATAATVAVDRQCYRPGQQGTISGAGYTPGATVNFTRNGAGWGGTTADAAGNLVPIGFTSGTVPGDEQQQTLAASDRINAAQTVFTATNLDVAVSPRRGNPGRRKRIRARGYDEGRTLYAHVRGKRRRNLRVGKLRGPCGRVSARKRVFRSSDPSGTYRVQFDQSRRYSRRARPRVIFTVTISRLFRPRRGFVSAFGADELWTRLR